MLTVIHLFAGPLLLQVKAQAKQISIRSAVDGLILCLGTVLRVFEENHDRDLEAFDQNFEPSPSVLRLVLRLKVEHYTQITFPSISFSNTG